MTHRLLGFVVVFAMAGLVFAVSAANPGQGLDPDAPRGRYVSPGARHKIILDAQDGATYADLASRGAILEEFDYGSFKMVVVSEAALGGRDALQRQAAVSDEQNLILLNGYALDTTNPEATWRQLPDDLRASNSPDILAQGVSAAGALYLAQFAGPIQDAWLDALKDSGVEVVSYIPNNAYVVRATRDTAGRLAGMKQDNSFLQFVGNYEPAFRLSPPLRQIRQDGKDESVAVTVQVVDGSDAEQTIGYLKAIASEFVGSHRVMNYHNIALTVSAARLGEIAALEAVFAVEERGQRRRLDEAQGQIVAGNLSGNAPSGPGYRTWLLNKGFDSSQFTDFAINVVDDAYSLTGHPDLPNARVAFENNPTNQSGDQGGHGFLNAHIVGGYNNQTGSDYEDANNYNYGLGIAPWARVGVTAIFGNGSATSTAWEDTAYGQGARISTNSWGWTSGGRPVARYDSNAQEYDRIVRDAQTGAAGLQQMVVAFAAGNFGSGSNTVSSPATAKNVIAVGAGENVRQTGTDGCGITDTDADSANDIAFFSSRGPVNAAGSDGRIKPDIVAPGSHIQAGVPQSNYNGTSVCDQFWPAGNTLYGWSSGTSHSCPAVAGGAALVHQDFLNKGRAAPSPAMVKAYLMNSATHMTGADANDTLPSNSQGMGRMDLGRAFDSTARLLLDQTRLLDASGQTYQVIGHVVSTNQPFRVTLAWTDAPGPTTGAPFVNNLDLEVTVNGTTYKGNVFSGANSASGGSADTRNNVESVFLPAGVSGSFTVTVRATNIADDGVPGNSDATDQDFALVVYNATPDLVTKMVSTTGGVVTAFESGPIYLSPDGQNLGGGGNTTLVYGGTQTVKAMIPYQNGVITAFSGRGIYYSPDGQNLGGGGNTSRVYFGTQDVVAMIPYQSGVITAFSGNGIYSSPDGFNVGGGGNTTRVYFGTQRVVAMIPYQSGVITAFSSGAIYYSPDGQNLGGGGSTTRVYGGSQQVVAMIAYQNGVITAFSGKGIYYSPDGQNLGGGGNTSRVYFGTQTVVAMIPYQSSVITAFSGNGIYSSPDGFNVGGGGNTTRVYFGTQRVVAMIPHQSAVITAFIRKNIYFSPDGLNLGGGGNTIRVYWY